MIREFPSSETLAEALATHVADLLAAQVASAGSALLAVSGGATPGKFFAALSAKNIAWPQITILLVDERWVPESSPRSNTALVKAGLLQNHAAAAHFLPFYNGAATPEAGCAAFTLPSPLTVAVLGMGADGHTASFFPGGSHLADALNRQGNAIVLPMRAEGAGEPRITLTLPVLLAAGHVIIHFEGTAKRATLAQAQTPGPESALPIRAILTGRNDAEIFWSP